MKGVNKMENFRDEFGYEIVKFFSDLLNWVLGLFGIVIPEDLPEEYQ